MTADYFSQEEPDGGGDKRLRVVFVVTGYPNINRPNSHIFTHRSIKILTQHIDAQVIDLRAWLPGRPLVEKRRWEGINVVTICCPQSPFKAHIRFNTFLLHQLGGVLARTYIASCDLIHSTDLYPMGFIAGRWAEAFHKPHTTQVIGSDLNIFFEANINDVEKGWLYRLRGFACNSMALAKRLTELVPGLQNVHVIYRGVDSNLFAPDGSITHPQANRDPIRFLYLGGFHTWNPKSPLYNIKGGHILLEAWRQIEDRIAPSSLCVGGPGANDTRLERWRQSLHRPQAVFLNGTVPPTDVPARIRSCDVVIIPSLSEGLPNLANEAQACGRPVLATDAGGTPESVIHGETGLIVPKGNVNALAEGMLWFRLHQIDIARMGSNARQHMLENFSINQGTQEMLTLFKNSIQHHHLSKHVSSQGEK